MTDTEHGWERYGSKEDVQYKECEECQGNGELECRDCNGSGECKHCGDGLCGTCGGARYFKCAACKGEGEFEIVRLIEDTDNPLENKIWTYPDIPAKGQSTLKIQ